MQANPMTQSGRDARQFFLDDGRSIIIKPQRDIGGAVLTIAARNGSTVIAVMISASEAIEISDALLTEAGAVVA
jgi:hypothetical protein